MTRILRVLILAALALSAASPAHAAWPVKPLNESHVVRGSFLDARGESYHHGVDVPVNDARPERGAPSWASHRVYAVADGVVSYQAFHSTASGSECTQNRTAVGRFIYYHVVSTVRSGSYVRRGQFIGWTCRGRWHVHITEGFGSNPVNPLRPGGALGPYHNPLKPVVEQIAPFTACNGQIREYKGRTIIPQCGRKLPNWYVRGLVDVRFQAVEPQPKSGLFTYQPHLYAPNQPYAASVTVRRLVGPLPGKPAYVAYQRQIWRANDLASQPPATVRWSPGFARWLPLWQCAKPHNHNRCAGSYWFRAFARRESTGYYRYWDTTKVADGRYRITIALTSTTGKRSMRRLNVVVANNYVPMPPKPPAPQPETHPDPPEAFARATAARAATGASEQPVALSEAPVAAMHDEDEIDAWARAVFNE